MKRLWSWLRKPIPADVWTHVIPLTIVEVLAIWVVAFRQAEQNWKKAHDSLLIYTKMTPQVLIKDHGWLTPDPQAEFHIIIGYQIDNCIIELPPDRGVVSGNDIYVDNPRIKHVFELAKGGR